MRSRTAWLCVFCLRGIKSSRCWCLLALTHLSSLVVVDCCNLQMLAGGINLTLNLTSSDFQIFPWLGFCIRIRTRMFNQLKSSHFPLFYFKMKNGSQCCGACTYSTLLASAAGTSMICKLKLQIPAIQVFASAWRKSFFSLLTVALTASGK